MGLFKRTRREHAVTTLLRHMERKQFAKALRYVRKTTEGPVPPPHALWRLGRWCIDQSRHKAALQPLELFMALYPKHQDRPEVMRDLVRVLAQTGRRKEAEELKETAEAMGRKRAESQRDHHMRQRAMSGRDKTLANSA